MDALLSRLVYMTWPRAGASSIVVTFDCQINSHAEKYLDYLNIYTYFILYLLLTYMFVIFFMIYDYFLFTNPMLIWFFESDVF